MSARELYEQRQQELATRTEAEAQAARDTAARKAAAEAAIAAATTIYQETVTAEVEAVREQAVEDSWIAEEVVVDAGAARDVFEETQQAVDGAGYDAWREQVKAERLARFRAAEAAIAEATRLAQEQAEADAAAPYAFNLAEAQKLADAPTFTWYRGNEIYKTGPGKFEWRYAGISYTATSLQAAKDRMDIQIAAVMAERAAAKAGTEAAVRDLLEQQQQAAADAAAVQAAEEAARIAAAKAAADAAVAEATRLLQEAAAREAARRKVAADAVSAREAYERQQQELAARTERDRLLALEAEARRLAAEKAIEEATDIYQETVTPLEEMTREFVKERDSKLWGPELLEAAEEELLREGFTVEEIVTPYSELADDPGDVWKYVIERQRQELVDQVVTDDVLVEDVVDPIVEGLDPKVDGAVRKLLFLAVVASIFKALARD